jgi:phage shock protein C
VQKRLTRRTDDRMIAGVASGVADYFGIDVTIARLLFLLLLLPGGLSPLLYVLLWIVMPERQPGTDTAVYPGSAPVSGAEPYRYDPSTGEPL